MAGICRNGIKHNSINQGPPADKTLPYIILYLSIMYLRVRKTLTCYILISEQKVKVIRLYINFQTQSMALLLGSIILCIRFRSFPSMSKNQMRK